MPRKPRTVRNAEGRVRADVYLPENVWAVLATVGHEASKLLGPIARISSDDDAGKIGLAFLMRHVCDLITDGDVTWIPDRAFTKAIASLKGGNFGVIPDGTPAINLDLLHKSTKLKSGYYGVYANGNGFRAMGRDIVGKTIVIGTFQSVEEAAHRRMLYHRANNVAYGELEVEMERWRKDNNAWGAAGKSDEQLIAEIKDHAHTAGTHDQIFGPGSATIEPVFSKKLPKREDALAKPVPKILVAAETKLPEGFEKLNVIERAPSGLDSADVHMPLDRAAEVRAKVKAAMSDLPPEWDGDAPT